MNLFNSPRLKWLSQIVIVLVLMSLVFAPTYEIAQADPITIVISVVVAVTATVIVDYVSCGFNIFWYCNSRDRNGGGRNGDDDDNSEVVLVEDRNGRFNPIRPGVTVRDGTECFSAANACGARDAGEIESGVCSASTPPNSICCASTANACGMVNYEPPQGYNNWSRNNPRGNRNSAPSCSGVTVTPPPNSSCPAPTVTADNFYADPQRVREGNTTTLRWKDIINATACSLTGGGLSLANLGLNGTRVTNTITGPTNFTLTCINGVGGPQTSETTQVTLIPAFQEI